MNLVIQESSTISITCLSFSLTLACDQHIFCAQKIASHPKITRSVFTTMLSVMQNNDQMEYLLPRVVTLRESQQA